MDKDQLETMLVNEYKSFASLIENGKIDQIAEKLYPSYKEKAQSLFYTKTENQEILNWFLEGYILDNPQPYPIEKYKMTFWGNGRMVTLESLDFLFEPALEVRFSIDKGKSSKAYSLFFHIPEGSDKLEIIR